MIPLTRLRGYYCNYGLDKFGITSWLYNALCHWWEKDILISRIFRVILTKIWFDLWLCNGIKVWNLVKMGIMHKDLKTINQQNISFYTRCTHRAQCRLVFQEIGGKMSISDNCCWIYVMIDDLMSGNFHNWCEFNMRQN